jgi:hypothetical protein
VIPLDDDYFQGGVERARDGAGMAAGSVDGAAQGRQRLDTRMTGIRVTWVADAPVGHDSEDAFDPAEALAVW